jgi:3-methylfumaryl-CoA hydratase
VSLLASAVDGWSPGPVTDTAVVAPGPAAAFAALLDRPAPPLADGDPLPPGWHAFPFLDRPATADLGEDGHPREGHFLPLRIGAAVERTSSLARCSVEEGRSGEMLLVTVRSEYGETDRPLLTEEQDVVYRSQPAGSSPAPAGAGAPVADDDGPAVQVLPDPALLLEVVRRHAPDRSVTSAGHRLARPAYAGTPVRATGRFGGDRVELTAGAVGSPASATGTVTLEPTP